MSDISVRVRKLVGELLGLGDDQLADEASGTKRIFERNDAGSEAKDASLGGDSLDWVELVMMVEEEFSIEISDDEAERDDIATIDGLTEFVEQKLAG